MTVKKHILLIIWVILFFGVAVVSALFTVLFRTDQYYDLFFIIDATLLVLLIPVVCIDMRLASGSKVKQKDQEIKHKDVELLEKDVELLQKEVELEKLRKQRAEITEEDITLSKERHICLVHKGSIQGYSFICPHCGSFYCMKCLQAVITIENECWSCGEELDADAEPVEKSVGKEIDVLKSKPELNEHKSSSPKLNSCPYCGNKIRPNDEFCTQCGSRLD